MFIGAFGATRTFQSGKLAKKAAAEYLAAKERHDAVARAANNNLNSSGFTNMDDEEVRGPSLMQLHLQQKTASEAQAQALLGGKDKRRPFDREKVCDSIAAMIKKCM